MLPGNDHIMQQDPPSRHHTQRAHGYREWLGLAAAVAFLAICVVAVVRRPPDAAHGAVHAPLMGPVWDTINESSGAPDRLEHLNGRTVSLEGYMIPINAGRRHGVFLLSVLPINQCMFCGQDGIPPMIEVTLAGHATLAYSEHPITVQGVVYLNKYDDTRPAIQLREADRIASGD